MARTGVSRLCQSVLRQYAAVGHGRAAAAPTPAPAPLRPPPPAWATPSRRGLATKTTTTNASPAVAAEAPGARQQDNEAESGDGDGDVLDEAAARRAELLKRYGDRTPPPGPKAVKADPGKANDAKAGGFDVEKAAASEVNHNEIWGDYVRYMEHQRKKGWKT